MTNSIFTSNLYHNTKFGSRLRNENFDAWGEIIGYINMHKPTMNIFADFQSNLEDFISSLNYSHSYDL